LIAGKGLHEEDVMTWQEMAEKVAWLGHDAFRIEASKTIYFDPYGIAGGPKADLILVSHDHFDHCSPDDVAKVQKPGTVIVTEKNSAKKLSGDVRVIRPGDTADV
jgi:L-ascorbate metabolism protein UlaG (beta-lactamase superfamily)